MDRLNFENYVFGPNKSLSAPLPIDSHNKNEKINHWEMITKEELKEIYLVTHIPIYYNKHKYKNNHRFFSKNNVILSEMENIGWKTIPSDNYTSDLDILNDSTNSDSQEEEL